MSVCKGCGIELQTEDKTKLGYTPKAEADLCQRCFRIRNYDDVVVSMKQGIDPFSVLAKIRDIDATILWVVDLFDFEANMVHGMNRHLAGKKIVMVATKRDLLPSTLSDKKLLAFIENRLTALQIKVSEIIIVGDLRKPTMRKREVEHLKKSIEAVRGNANLLAMGMANAGKSTLLNAILDEPVFTSSRYPGTTLDVVEVKQKDYILYDTPGLTREDSYLSIVDDEILKRILPKKVMKPMIYQLKGNQSIAVDGLARLDLSECNGVTCVCYMSSDVQIHRGKMEAADNLWERHLGELLSPTMDSSINDMSVFQITPGNSKMDVVIHGLGWFSISGELKEVKVYVHKGISVSFRKAMM